MDQQILHPQCWNLQQITYVHTKAHSVRTEQVLCSPHSFASTLSIWTNRGMVLPERGWKRTVTLALFPDAECWTKSSYETALLEWSTKVPSCDRQVQSSLGWTDARMVLSSLGILKAFYLGQKWIRKTVRKVAFSCHGPELQIRRQRVWSPKTSTMWKNWRITQASQASVLAIGYSLYWIKLNAILKP